MFEVLVTAACLMFISFEIWLEGFFFSFHFPPLVHIINFHDFFCALCSSVSTSLLERDDEVTMSATFSLSMSISQPASRRTRSPKTDNQVDEG